MVFLRSTCVRNTRWGRPSDAEQDTTTFYKAEVSTAWRNKDAGSERGTPVRLRFEGEQEEAKETEVERRFVLLDK